MKKLLVFCAISFAMIIWGCEQKTSMVESNMKDGVFIHISHGPDDVHRLLMGLQMAVLMSENKDVLVYFDITGVNAVLKDSQNFEFAHFPGSRIQLDKLLSKGVVVMACPGCLKAAGKTENDLMEGVKIADKETFFTFTKGRILTMDY